MRQDIKEKASKFPLGICKQCREWVVLSPTAMRAHYEVHRTTRDRTTRGGILRPIVDLLTSPHTDFRASDGQVYTLDI